MKEEKTAEKKEVRHKETERQLVDIAISCGRFFQSSQTGFIHYTHEYSDEVDLHDSIPLYENFLFALALFRSRIGDRMNEAKQFLGRLLAFQNKEEQTGNFPFYIHEFPKCRDRSVAPKILLPLYWIYHDYKNILGEELKGNLLKVLDRALDFSWNYSETSKPYFSVDLKIAAASEAIGKLLGREELGERGREKRGEIEANLDKASWFNPKDCGDLLAALQLLNVNVKEVQGIREETSNLWRDFWCHLEKTWHKELCCYVGPAFKVRQQEMEPEPTLYDLYMGYYAGNYAYRVFDIRIFQMEAALIQASQDQLVEHQYPVKLEGLFRHSKWQLLQTKDYACCVLEKIDNKGDKKGEHPLRLIWGDRNKTHSFVCQGGNSYFTDFTWEKDSLDLVFSLGEEVEVDDNKKNQEVAFFVDADAKLRISVEGNRVTAFQLGEEIKLYSNDFLISLILDDDFKGIEEEKQKKIKEEERFFGHIMRGNRPSQICCKGKHRFSAFDWKVYLRAIHRASPHKVKAKLFFSKKGKT